ncbi:malto-oligosyltrehalose trehalohydrolase [Novosphingobium malaysiense]|uniref:malto-oligosyltrehalose trehalohydrolase n=1 Tax=Novosphingobium malaysiense TaxID=1348853 RepID=UPI00068FA80A|nr:malto-oligosyltrehalose trehalohydrolase [Novosphingobium malaysiense]
MSCWGPLCIGPGHWRFRLWAPGAEALTLEIADRTPLTMTPEKDGWWHAETQALPGTRYRFRLADGLAIPDPASRGQNGGVHGWSVLADADDHAWQTADWRGRHWHEAVIMEVHAGLMGGFGGIEGELPRLRDLGITAIELMPLGAFSGQRNWGYDGVLPFAPAESYGTPADLKRLIDRAHELDIMVLVDVVYNHFGPDGNYLGLYAPDFFHADLDTPWGGAVAVDRPQVAAFFLENALMWLEDFRADGLRLDAVHAIGNTDFLDKLAYDIRERIGPDRHVHLVLENESNDADRLAAGLYDAQWNDDFHNVMHVLLTGEDEAYYADFADRPAERLARCLAEGFIYQGEPSPTHKGRIRGKPSGHLRPTAFVSFLQNHDQIGNRATGERLTLLAPADPLRAATALLLLAPQIPLLFMGDEIGSRSPFLFFTDFHDALADAVREGRRREFARFAAFRDEAARARIPDPNAPETFEASRPEAPSDAAEWTALYRSLIALRTRDIVPRLAGSKPEGADVLGDAAVSARWRMSDGTRLTLALNLGADGVDFPESKADAIFTLGRAGAGGSFAAWLEET